MVVLSGKRRNWKRANVDILVAMEAVYIGDRGTMIVVSPRSARWCVARQGPRRCFVIRQGSWARNWFLKPDSDDLAAVWKVSIVDILVGDQFAGGSKRRAVMVRIVRHASVS